MSDDPVTVNVYRDGLLYVRAAQCDHCLFGKDRLVAGPRARQIIADARAHDGGTFVCHRGQGFVEPESVCAVYFDRYADQDWILRLAIASGIVRRVSIEQEEDQL